MIWKYDFERDGGDVFHSQCGGVSKKFEHA